MNEQEMIEVLKDSGAKLDGHFLLTSGRHSNIYIEKFRLLENPFFLDKICKELSKYFFNKKIDIVLGAAIGGILIAGGIGRHLNKKNFFTERVNGKMELKRGFVIKPNDRVLIVEDIVTTGSSVFEMIDVVKQSKATVVNVVCLVDRSKDGVDFKVPKTVLLRLPSQDWSPQDCPNCLNGIELTSRGRTGK